MGQLPEMMGGVPGGVKNNWMTLLLAIVWLLAEFNEPIIDRWTGKYERDEQHIYKIVDSVATKANANLNQILRLDTNYASILDILETKISTEGTSTFATGIRYKLDSSQPYYKASDGNLYEAQYVLSERTWKYVDNGLEKATQ